MDDYANELIFKAQEAVKCSIVSAMSEYDKNYKQELQNELNNILIKVAELGEKVGLETPDLACLHDKSNKSVSNTPKIVEKVKKSTFSTTNASGFYNPAYSNNDMSDLNNTPTSSISNNLPTVENNKADNNMSVEDNNITSNNRFSTANNTILDPTDPDVEINMSEYSQKSGLEPIGEINYPRPIDAPTMLNMHENSVNLRKMADFCRENNKKFILADEQMVFTREIPSRGLYNYRVPNDNYTDYDTIYKPVVIAVSRAGYPVLATNPRAMLASFARGYFVTEKHDNPTDYPLGDEHRRSLPRYNGAIVGEEDNPRYYDAETRSYKYSYTGKPMKASKDSEFMINKGLFIHPGGHVGVLDSENAPKTLEASETLKTSENTNDLTPAANNDSGLGVENTGKTTVLADSNSTQNMVDQNRAESANNDNKADSAKTGENSSISEDSSNTGLFNKPLDEALWEHNSKNERVDSALSNGFKQNGGFMSGKEFLEVENRVLEAASANNLPESAKNSQNEAKTADSEPDAEKVPDYIAKHTHVHEDGKVYVSNMADAEHQSPTGIYLEPMFSEENEPAHSPSYENTYGNMCIPGKKPYEFKSTYDMRVEKETKEREAYKNAFKNVFKRVSKGQEFDDKKDYFTRYEHHYMANKLVEKEAYELLTKSAEMVEKDPYYNSNLSTNLSPDTIFNLIRYNQYFDGDHILASSSESSILDELKHGNNLFVFLYVSIHDYIQSFEDSIVQKYENKDDLLNYRKSIVAAIKRRCKLITGGYDDTKLVREYFIDMAISQTKGDMTVEDKNTISADDNALGAVIPTELYGVFYALSGMLQKMLKFNKFIEKTGMNPAQMYNRFVAKHPDYAQKYENNIRELAGGNLK